MLSIEFDGMCKGCRCADIHVEGYKMDEFFDSSSEMRYEVVCSHEDACKMWDRRMHDFLLKHD